MRELDEVLTRAVNEGANVLAGARPDAATSAAVTGAVRSRRRTRHTMQAVAALPVVAVLTVGGWALAGQVGTPAPVATQTPGPTEPAPTDAPSDLAPPSGAALLPSETGLPDRLRAPEGVLDRAGAGWVLAAYATPPGKDPAMSPNGTAILLSAPDGSLYELQRLSSVDGAPAGSWLSYELLDWDAKAGTALLTRAVAAPGGDVPQGDVVSGATLVRLDLRSGAVTSVPGWDDLDGWGWLGRTAEGGAWQHFDAQGTTIRLLTDSGQRRDLPVKGESVAALLGPDAERMVVGTQVLDLRTGDTAVVPGLAAETGCSPLSWWTGSSVLATCENLSVATDRWLDRAPRLVEVSVDGKGAAGTVVRTASAADTVYPLRADALFTGRWLADRRVLVEAGTVARADGPTACDGAGTVLEVTGPGAGFAPLPTADVRGLSSVVPGVVGGLLAYTSTPGGCTDHAPTSTLTVVDLAAGTARLAVPLPAGLAPDDTSELPGVKGFALWR
jgi:hypothetical protein